MPGSPGSSNFGYTDHGNLNGLGDDDHTQYPYFTTGTGTPVGAVTPQRVGHIYVATDLENAWIATNTTNSDWEQLDAAGGGGGGSGPSVSTGAGVPGSPPSAEGDIYIDTTNDQSYMAVGTASSSDWKQTSNLPQGITSVSDDTSPTLGGNLDGGGFAITNIGNIDGRDVSADGTKLDGIESGATADQSEAEIRALQEYHLTLMFVASSINISTPAPASSGVAQLINSHGAPMRVNLSEYTRARVTVMRGTTTRTNLKLAIKYKTGAPTGTYGDYSPLGTASTEVEIACPTGNTFYQSAWIDLASGAIADDISLAMCWTDGNSGSNVALVRVMLELDNG